MTGKFWIAALLLAFLTPAIAGSTMQRDAPMVRFYTPDGKSAGSASTYGNTMKFYAPDGKLIGTATHKMGSK